MFRSNCKQFSSSYRQATLDTLVNGLYAHCDLLKLNNFEAPQPNTGGNFPSRFIENMANWDTVDYYNLFSKNSGGTSPIIPFDNNYNRDFLFVDKNLINFWSPDVLYNYENIINNIENSDKVGLYGFSFLTGNNSDIIFDTPGRDTLVTFDFAKVNTPNYFNGNYVLEFNTGRRLWTEYDQADPHVRQCIPIWSPKTITSTQTTTRLDKSGFNYFGLNRSLKSDGSLDSADYIYLINNPKVLYNDSEVLYKTNLTDNIDGGGLILYSKYTEKNYVGGSYKNPTRHSDGTSELLTVDSGMSMKYNSNIHSLFSFKLDGGKYKCIPRISNLNTLIYSENNLVQESSVTNEYMINPFYRGDSSSNTEGFTIDLLNRDTYMDDSENIGTQSYNALPIFDIYSNVTTDTKYGGLNESALYSNTWIPCGEPVSVTGNAIDVIYSVGDTYIQRFDFLRIFPNDMNQISQVTEITSFICESFINLDGRDDVNRYNTNSTLMSTSNYGLLNKIYSQKNNYFTYNVLDIDRFKANLFRNTIVWTKTKVSGELIDNWTNINMISSIDLDGVYGTVESINLFNNDLYTFQKKGVARLLFNERIQQQASDGISVELTNGYKVPEYRYITNQYGCDNKWSIVEGKGGIYFIDYTNKSLMSISDGIKDIGSTAGFKSWFNENTSEKNYTLSYDRINSDLYIHDGNACLNYSEILQSFISFYDYVEILQMKNIWDDFISIKPSSISNIWLNNKGDYNMFYGVQQPFSVEYLLNSEPLNDKVFNTIEYRLNNQYIDWNKLEVSDWYQYGELNDMQYLSNLKRKFNVNRIQFPRQSMTLDDTTGTITIDTRNSLNRIRSTWAKLKLCHNTTTTNINKKFDMQDLTVTYTV